jgi:hypothetical protein
MTEAAQVLFGQNDDNARKRALYLFKNHNIPLFKSDRKFFVRRDVLQKYFGVDQNINQNTADNLSTASVSSPD